MIPLYQNIRNRRIEIGMSQEELAEKLGYKSRSTIAKIEAGVNDITQSKIIAFAQTLNTTVGYLMGDTERNISELEKYGLKPIKTKKFPMFGEIACGQPIYANEDYETFIEASERINADFCLTAKGDSMINARIFDGDIVFIKEQPDVDNGEIAAVLIEDEVTLKRVYKYENRLELRPENPLHSVQNYEGETLNHIRILGKAVVFQSNVR